MIGQRTLEQHEISGFGEGRQHADGAMFPVPAQIDPRRAQPAGIHRSQAAGAFVDVSIPGLPGQSIRKLPFPAN